MGIVPKNTLLTQTVINGTKEFIVAKYPAGKCIAEKLVKTNGNALFKRPKPNIKKNWDGVLLNKKNGSKKIQAKKILPLARLMTSKCEEANRKNIKERPHNEASNMNIAILNR